jgi:hypothetical protein
MTDLLSDVCIPFYLHQPSTSGSYREHLSSLCLPPCLRKSIDFLPGRTTFPYAVGYPSFDGVHLKARHFSVKSPAWHPAKSKHPLIVFPCTQRHQAHCCFHYFPTATLLLFFPLKELRPAPCNLKLYTTRQVCLWSPLLLV